MRILSLLPSATEIVCALGLEDRLVGRSHECDYPPSVGALPVCTEATIDSSQTSAAIDAQVRDLLERALSLYHVRAELLAEIAPNIVVTQTQCEVCAVSLEEVERAVAQTIGPSASVVSLAATDFEGVLRDVARVAQACGVGDRGERLVGDLRATMDRIRRRGRERASRLRIAAIEWTEPLMTAGNWVPELIECAGGDAVLARVGEHSPWIKWEDLAGEDPDVIVVMPCGFSLERTMRETIELCARSEWAGLRAVRAGNVYAVDANHYFSRPGPRLVDSAAIIAEILDDIAGTTAELPRYRGSGWRRVTRAED